MESETCLLCDANDCHVGGSLGFTASDLAEEIILQDPSIMALPADVIGSWEALA